MSLLATLKPNGPSGFGYGSTASEVTEGLDLSGKTYLLTGCNSGIGLETLKALSSRGAHMIAAARTVEKATRASEGLPEVTPVACELSEPGSVRACVEAVKATGRALDGVICNAGIMALPELTLQHGYELQFMTNHIGHFILVTGLLDALSAEGRVVMVSSAAHKTTPRGGIRFDNLDGSKGYQGWMFYGQSKLANLLLAKELSRRFMGTRKTANALHPGVIKTNLGRHMGVVANIGLAIGNPLFLKSIPQGAATQCYVATHPSLAGVSGEYFADCNVARPSRHARDADLARKLWETSEEIVAGL